MQDVMVLLKAIDAKVDANAAHVEQLKHHRDAQATSDASNRKRARSPSNPPVRPSAPLCGWASADVIEKVLYSRNMIEKRVTELAVEISRDYPDATEENFVVVGLMSGVYMFMADFTRQLTVPHTVDFVSVSSYGLGTVSSANVKIKKDMESPIEGKHVLLLDEMCDTGGTMACLKKLVLDRGASSVRVCVLLDKAERRAADVKLDYTGWVCADEFLVGYGLDWSQRFRSLRDICIVKRSAYASD